MAQTVVDVFNNVFGEGGRVRDGSVKLLDRKLSNRSKLDFVFPQGNGTPIIFELPFYENPQITELKGARLMRYNPISRSGPMHSYLGGKPRVFNLEFNLTLPHLQFESTALSIDRFMSRSLLESKEQRRVNFLLSPTSESLVPDKGKSVSDPLMRKVQDAIRYFFGTQTSVNEGIDNDEITALSYWHNTAALAVLYWWVNLIRASVINNSRNPTLGPPIIRLTHGLLYSNIPCVCSDYSIEVIDAAGYELRSLTPRRLLVSMNLEETRSGDFEEFDPDHPIRRDNNAGWEAIFEHGTTDPAPHYS